MDDKTAEAMENPLNIGEGTEDIIKIFEEQKAMPNFIVGLGIYLDLQYHEKKIKCKTNIYGWYPYEFFISGVPSIDGREIDIKPGSMVTVRYVLDGMVFGFNTTLMRKVLAPRHLWLLRYPDIVHTKILRKHNRLQMMIPVSINGGDQEGLIMDLSIGGAMIGGNVKYSVDDKLNLGFTLPGGQKIEGLKAVVKNVNLTEVTGHVGVEFHDDNKEAISTIRKFIDGLPHQNTSLH